MLALGTSKKMEIGKIIFCQICKRYLPPDEHGIRECLIHDASYWYELAKDKELEHEDKKEERKDNLS